MGKFLSIFITLIFFLFLLGSGCVSTGNSANHDQESAVIKTILEKHDVWKDWDDYNIDTTSAIDPKHPNLSPRERQVIQNKANNLERLLRNKTIGNKIVFWNLTSNSRIKDSLPLERQADLSRDTKYDVVFVIEERGFFDNNYFSIEAKKSAPAYGATVFYEVVHMPAGSGEGIDRFGLTPPSSISSSDFYGSIYDGPLNQERIVQLHQKFSDYIGRLPIKEYPDTPVIPPGPRYNVGDIIAENQNSVTAYMVTGYEDVDGDTWYKLVRYELEASSVHGANQMNKGMWMPSYGAGGAESMGTIAAEKKYPILVETIQF